MKKELNRQILDIKKRISDAILKLDLTGKESELDLLDSEASKATFWSDPENAKLVMQKINILKELIAPWRKIEKESTDILEMLPEIDEESDLLTDATKQVQGIEEELRKHETQLYFGGKYDFLNAVFSVYAGAGGVDAQDWAEMVLSMLLKYCDKNHLKTNIISISSGTEAGIKSVSVEVTGPFAYGLLKSERGVHRLVRLSPFDADKARHTSFVLVEVIPEIEAGDINIPENELKIDTFRASGHGGQSVNTTDSAVRITHLPTGITVSVQNERSQLQNKETALKILKSRLKTLKEAEKESQLKIIKGELTANEWGSQIRSYVLHPYQMVKDHRTGHETSNTQNVLSGNLEEFVQAYLKKEI